MTQSHVEQTLAQLAETFTVRDIMIDAEDLVRANDPAEAEELLDRNSDYDHIPLPAQGTIGGYVARDDHKFHPLQHNDLVSESTSLLMLPELLTERTFYFVLASNRIRGFVHFSDLNNSLMKLPLFVLFEAMEGHFARLVAEVHPTDVELCSVLGEERVKELQRRKAKASARRANHGPLDFIYFDELLCLCEHYHLIQIKGKDHQNLSNFRNRVAHNNHLLIEDRSDVHRLVSVRDVAKQLLAVA